MGEWVPVALEGPLDIPTSLDALRRGGDDGLDRWTGDLLIRTVRAGDRAVPFAARPAGNRPHPVLMVTTPQPDDLPAALAAARRTFLPLPPELDELCRRDAVLAGLQARYPGLREVRQLDLYGALVRAISAQQVNLGWAAATRRRLAECFGERHEVAGEVVYSLTPARLAGAAVGEIRALQFTQRKAEYVVSLAGEIVAGRLAGLEEAPDEAVIDRLMALRGVGRWTAEWLLVRYLGRPRVVAGDLGVRRAVGRAYLGGRMPVEAEVRSLTAGWGPAAAAAQTLLLRAHA